LIYKEIKEKTELHVKPDYLKIVLLCELVLFVVVFRFNSRLYAGGFTFLVLFYFKFATHFNKVIEHV